MENTKELLPIEKAILIELYLRDQISSSLQPIDSIFENISKKLDVSPNRMGFGRLRTNGLIATGTRSSGERSYKISDLGIQFVEDSIKDDSDVLKIFHKLEYKYQQKSPNDNAEKWEPLNLEHNAVFEDTISKVEGAFEAIRSSNGFAETEPEVRNGIIETIQGTLRGLATGAISRGAILNGLIAPLNFVVKKFGDSLVSNLAKRAVDALFGLLGS